MPEESEESGKCSEERTEEKENSLKKEREAPTIAKFKRER